MKIVYYIFQTHTSGGMERILTDKVNYLAEKFGYEITIITTDQKDKKPFYRFSSKIQQKDLEINYTDDLRKGPISRLRTYIKNSSSQKRLRMQLQEIRPDVVVSMQGNEMYFLNKLKDGSKKILERHFTRDARLIENQQGIWKILEYIRLWYDGRIAAQFDKFVILTQEDKSAWPYQDNILIIPNFVNLNKENVLSDLSGKRVIAVGRIVYQKGFDRLVRAWEKVQAVLPDWELTIFGGVANQEIEQELEKLILSLNLKESVHIFPPTGHIDREYLDSSLFVLSSRYEGLPLVLVEAMSFGLPAVAFTCKCGPKDVITDHWDGILVPEGNVDQLAKAIIELLQDPDKLSVYGRNAFEKSKQFNEENIMKRWKHLFESLKAEKDQSHKSVQR
ncbi:MAG: glycosyltransferase family 4 protein [Bacteroides sp.]|nr:glycosyltransferase family 4 protein [Bacteroides sp.]